MKKSFFIFILSILTSISLTYAEDLGAIDRHMIELSQETKYENGQIKHRGLFNSSYTLISSGDEFPDQVIEGAYEYLKDNLQFLRVYKVNNKKINDGRAIGYVSVFGSVAVTSSNKTQVIFYYVFSNYRGRVILHMTSDGRL